MYSLYLSKLSRILLKNKPPNNCYEYLWRPYSLFEKCDCTVWCKFPSSHIPQADSKNVVPDYSKRYSYTFKEKKIELFKFL